MERMAALMELIKAAGYEGVKYSGRGMYGRQCVSIRTDDNAYLVSYKLGREFHNLPREMSTELMDLHEHFEQVKVDNIGHRNVLYFSSIEWVEAPAEDA